jgi:sulfite exporter TauE/SafE
MLANGMPIAQWCRMDATSLPAWLLDSPALSTAAAALVVGFSSSVHCFVMCGPLACAVTPGAGRRWAPVVGYQGARLAAYALVGGLLGTLGSGVGRVLSVDLAPIAPWFLVATLLATALDLRSRMPAIPLFAQIVRRAGFAAQGFPPIARAVALGGITPLLPCGLLYGAFAASVAAGSFGGGALALGAFGAGAVPALLLAQLPARQLFGGTGRLTQVARRVVPAVAAVAVAYRAIMVQAASAAGGGHSCH